MRKKKLLKIKQKKKQEKTVRFFGTYDFHLSFVPKLKVINN